MVLLEMAQKWENAQVASVPINVFQLAVAMFADLYLGLLRVVT